MSKVPLVIDGYLVQAEPGETLLDAARRAGVEVPTLCHHERTGTRGLCRLCVVEVEGWGRPVPACATEVQPNLVVRTETEALADLRRVVLELLALETDLSLDTGTQVLLERYHARPERWGAPLAARREREPVQDNPFFVRDYAKCYTCRRCIDACGEGVQGVWAYATTGRGHAAVPGTPLDMPLPETPCVFCGNCVQVCPTGALTPLAELAAAEGGDA